MHNGPPIFSYECGWATFRPGFILASLPGLEITRSSPGLRSFGGGLSAGLASLSRAGHFTRADVESVARLARLELAPDEQDLFARQLDAILGYARHVQDVDTNGVPPTSHALVTEMPLRDDNVQASLPRDEAQAAAPAAGHGLFKVPRVLG